MGYKVELNVYDLSGGMAKQHSRQLTGIQIEGIWHTGLVIHGKEYYYPGSSISQDQPACTPFGKPHKTIMLGETEVHEEMLLEILKESLCEQFSEKNFNLMNNNGNTFTNEFAEMLLGEGIPETIISANQSFLLTPKGRMMTQMVQRM